MLDENQLQKPSLPKAPLEQNQLIGELKMKQTAGHPSAYVAELRQGEWRVVVPVRGKLSPRIAQSAFANKRDASAWLQSEAGMQCVGALRTRA